MVSIVTRLVIVWIRDSGYVVAGIGIVRNVVVVVAAAAAADDDDTANSVS